MLTAAWGHPLKGRCLFVCVCVCVPGLEQQLEEQKKQQAQSWLALNSMVAPPPPPPTKRAPKRPRLQRPASTTTLLGSSTTTTSQAMTLQPQQFTVLSPITLTSMGQPFTLGNLPIATLAQPTNTVTLHTLPGGSQIFTRYTTAGAGGMSVVSADGKGDTYTLHPSSGLTLVGTATMQDPSQLGAMMSPVELVQLTQGAMGAEGMMVSASGAEVMEGTMLVQQELGRVVEEENQHTTVIEIDPAPGQQHTVGVMELQLAGASAEAVDEDEVTTVVVQGSMMTTADGGEEEEAEEGTPMEEQAGEEMQRGQGEAQEEEETEQGEGEEVTAGDLQLEAHGQLETLQIMVVEDGTPAANTEDK